MEHKLINGGDEFLPLARSRIKAMRIAGLEFASQKLSVDGADIEVRISGEHSYIRIDGSTGVGCVMPSVAYATTVDLVDGVEIAPTSVGGASLRVGAHTVATEQSLSSALRLGSVWGTSLFSAKHIEARIVFENSYFSAKIYLDDVLVDEETAASSTTGDRFSSTQSVKDCRVFGGVVKTDAAVILVQVLDTSQLVTRGAEVDTPPAFGWVGLAGVSAKDHVSQNESVTGAVENILYFGEYAEDGTGSRVQNSDGSYEMTFRKVIAKTTILDTESQITRGFGDLTVSGSGGPDFYRSYSTNGDSNGKSQSFGGPSATGPATVFTGTTSGAIFLATHHTETNQTISGSVNTVGVDVINLATVITSVQAIRISFCTKNGDTQEDIYEVSRTNIVNSLETVSGTTSNQTGSAITLYGIIEGSNRLCVGYGITSYPSGTVTDYMDVLTVQIVGGVVGLTIEKTISLGARTSTPLNLGFRKFRGAAQISGKYIWGTQYCFNIETEAFISIPGFPNGQYLNWNGYANYPNVDSNYYTFSKRGDEATYYRLFLHQLNIDTINAMTSSGSTPPGNPLNWGSIKKYQITADEYLVETVAQVGSTIAIEGTTQDRPEDLNGATLKFKRNLGGM